ncbi:hypothetical protein J437_LFUL007566, partial [Ladona fulva]
YYSSRRQLYEDDPLLQRSKQPVPDPRFITFQKEGSVGIRLTGGNEVNGMEMRGITREEAVLLLLGLQDQVQLIVQFRKDEYDQVVASQRGDSFHIKYFLSFHIRVNDRILSANGVSLEGVDYGTAVAVLRESGQTVTLSVKRRVIVQSQQQQQLSPNTMQQMPSPPPVPPHHHQLRVGHQYHAQTSSLPANTSASNGSSQHQRQNNIVGNLGGPTVVHQQQMLKLSLAKTKKKDDFGLVLGCKIYIREVGSAAAAAASVEDVESLETEENSGECGVVGSAVGGVPPSLQEGDVLLRINGHPTEGMSLKEARKALEGAKGDRVSLVVKREVAAVAQSSQPGHRNFVTGQQRHSETSALVK